jgi:hypothetical protein
MQYLSLSYSGTRNPIVGDENLDSGCEANVNLKRSR